jgi:mono/diheme cytochrome c family protein
LNQLDSKGKVIFGAHGCGDCHGMDGVGGTAAAPALANTGKTFSPEQLTTMLQHPTVPMQKGGMPPVSLSDGEMKALVAYVSSISVPKNSSRP